VSRPSRRWLIGAVLLLTTTLSGCMGESPRPLTDLDRALALEGSSRAASLGDGVLALIQGRGGRERVVLIDLERQRPLPLPGLNRPDAQPVSVAVDARGDRLAVVRQRQGSTELVLYRRAFASTQTIPLMPAGVPRQLAFDPDGHTLAVEVSRDGIWQIDLVELP
jgi:hypothetical protein